MVMNLTEQFEIPVTEDFITDQGRMETRERLHAKDRELAKIYNRIAGPIYRIDGVQAQSTWCLATRSNDDMMSCIRILTASIARCFSHPSLTPNPYIHGEIPTKQPR